MNGWDLQSDKAEYFETLENIEYAIHESGTEKVKAEKTVVSKEPNPEELLKQAQKKAAALNKQREEKKELETVSRLTEQIKKQGTARKTTTGEKKE